MIYKIDEWRKVDTQGHVIQQLFCLSDMHGAEDVRSQDKVVLNNIDQEQRIALIECLEQLKKEKALFLVEDAFGTSADVHKKIGAYLALYKPVAFNQPEGQRPILLQFLTDILSQHSCDVVNADLYRQQRLMSHFYGAVLNNCRRTASPLTATFHKNINTLYGVTLKEVAQEFKDGLEQIKSYSLSDGSVLVAYYETIIEKLESTVPFADLLGSTDYFYWDLLDGAYSSVQGALQSAFVLWGLEVVDAYALHTLYNAQNRSKVCIMAGGVHINNISVQLPKMGYQKVRTIGEDTLTVQEHAERDALCSELFNVNQFIPAKSVSWLDYLWQSVVNFFSKNRLVTDLTVDQEKLVRFTELNTKFCFAKPVDSADFKVLVEPTHASEVVQNQQEMVS